MNVSRQEWNQRLWLATKITRDGWLVQKKMSNLHWLRRGFWAGRIAGRWSSSSRPISSPVPSSILPQLSYATAAARKKPVRKAKLSNNAKNTRVFCTLLQTGTGLENFTTDYSVQSTYSQCNTIVLRYNCRHHVVWIQVWRIISFPATCKIGKNFW